MTEGPMSWVTGGDLPDERRVRMMFRGGFLRLDLFDGHLNVRLAPRILRFIPTLRGFANGRIVDLSEIVSIQLSQTKPSIRGLGGDTGYVSICAQERSGTSSCRPRTDAQPPTCSTRSPLAACQYDSVSTSSHSSRAPRRSTRRVRIQRESRDQRRRQR